MSMGRIKCCLCGQSIEPNAAAMCIECLRIQHSITDDFELVQDLFQCKTCDRWNVRLDNWMPFELESTGLLNMCLKKISGLQKPDTKLLDAVWVWTEPHSKRLKVSLSIERGVLDDKIKLRQNVIIEFIIKMKPCNDCVRDATEHNWGALIQIRQNNQSTKRSLLHLESLLSKTDLIPLILNIETKKEGLNLFFNHKNSAEKLLDFINSNLPIKMKSSKKVVSHNVHTHVAKQEFTMFVEIASINREDLIITTKDLTGGSIDLMLVYKISSSIHLINPLTLHKIDINSTKYFINPFNSLLTTKQLIKFVVMDINIINTTKSPINDDSFVLAEAEVCFIDLISYFCICFVVFYSESFILIRHY